MGYGTWYLVIVSVGNLADVLGVGLSSDTSRRRGTGHVDDLVVWEWLIPNCFIGRNSPDPLPPFDYLRWENKEFQVGIR